MSTFATSKPVYSLVDYALDVRYIQATLYAIKAGDKARIIF